MYDFLSLYVRLFDRHGWTAVSQVHTLQKGFTRRELYFEFKVF
jgi:hypothetical protein